MAERTYTGFAPRGRQILPTRAVEFERGAPVEVDADEAAFLDEAGDWSEPKPAEAKPAKPTTPKGSKPDTKES